MKIRNGFVSNSSSSSFVVAFSKKPETVEEVRDFMFEEETRSVSIYGITASTGEIAQAVFDGIQKQKDSATKEEITYALQGWADSQDRTQLPRRHDFESIEHWELAYKAACDRLSERCKKMEEEKADIFWRNHKNDFILIAKYEDHTDLGAVMEHAGIFRLPHIRISNH